MLFVVRVNAVAPGWIETPMTQRQISDQGGQVEPRLNETFRDEHAGISPLGLVGDPEDPAYAVLHLVSDAARFVTGA